MRSSESKKFKKLMICVPLIKGCRAASAILIAGQIRSKKARASFRKSRTFLSMPSSSSPIRHCILQGRQRQLGCPFAFPPANAQWLEGGWCKMAMPHQPLLPELLLPSHSPGPTQQLVGSFSCSSSSPSRQRCSRKHRMEPEISKSSTLIKNLVSISKKKVEKSKFM